MALDFPNTPVDGQVYDNFIYDASKGTWKSLSSGASPSLLVNPTITNAVITATATTPSTVPITVNAASSQTANLQDWKNSAGIVLADVDNVGNLQVPKIGIGGSAPPTSPSSTNLQVTGRAKILSNGSESAGIWLTGSNNVDTAFIGQFSTTTTDPVGIYHNGSWRFSVDSLGRVAAPFQPGFRAFFPSATGGGAIISFSGNDSAFSGRNSGWNGSTRFTAPIAGVYVFSFSILSNTPLARILFRINGTVSTNYGDSLIDGYNTYASPAMSMAFRLSANDYVELWNEQAATYGQAFGSFSGFLVG